MQKLMESRIPTYYLQLSIECWRKTCISLDICRTINVLAKLVDFIVLSSGERENGTTGAGLKLHWEGEVGQGDRRSRGQQCVQD